MKKNLILSVFSALFLVAPAYANDTPFQGRYASLGLGGVSGMFSTSEANSIINQDINLIVENTTLKALGNSLLASLALGYNFPIGCYFTLGVEALIDVENVKRTYKFSGHEIYSGTLVIGSLNTKLNSTFAALLKPGVLLGNTLGYGVIGARWGHFTVFPQSTFSFPQTGINSTIGDEHHASYKVGFTAGVGLEQYLCHAFSIGLEYNYTYYDHIAGPLSLSFSASGAGILENSIEKIHAQTNSMKINFVYHMW